MRGSQKAAGDYIAFLDSDDLTAPDLYPSLLKIAEQTSADLVQCGYDYFYEAEDLLIPRCSEWAKTDHATLRSFPELLFLDNVIWNKIYRRSMLERYGIRFDSSMKMAEDLPFFFMTLMAAEKIVITDRPLYYYRQGRPGQLTAQKNRNRFAVFQAFDNTNEFVTRHHFDYIRPYLLHSALSLFAYMYEPLDDNFKEEFFSTDARLLPPKRNLRKRAHSPRTMEKCLVFRQNALADSPPDAPSCAASHSEK